MAEALDISDFPH